MQRRPVSRITDRRLWTNAEYSKRSVADRDWKVEMKEAVIVSIARTAVGKAPRGTLRNTRPDDMAAAMIQEVIKRVPGLEASEVEDVILGCAMPEA